MPEAPNREIVIFNDALALPVKQRAAFLDEACRGDADLRRRVELLLDAHDRAGAFLADPAQKFDAGQTSILSKTPRREAVTGPAPGTTVRYVGDYELLDEIGRGGMGVVFRARQVSLNRIVAVKMILSGEYAGPDERRRFRREAESAAQLRHANIVTIHEVGEHEGRNYYSMDFIEGRSLSTALKESTMRPAPAAAMVKTLAEAVHFAHQRGTLHRDLKPQNVLMGLDGQPHILDFGLARPVEREAGLTRTGDVMGSPSYMPPEQATGRIGEIGPASDVYALGAILYEAITGSPPFTGETAMEVLSQVIDKDPWPPRKRNPGVPVDLETICLKCLEKQPERRYHSARALAEELERFLSFEPIMARPAGRLRKWWNWTQRNPWVFAAGFGLAALVLFCIAYALWEQTHVLHWRLEAGKNIALPARDVFFGLDAKEVPPWETPPTREESPALLFFLLFPAVCLTLYFTGRAFQSGHRRHAEGGAALSPWSLVQYALAGMGAAVLGLSYLLLQIRSWMWQASLGPFVLVEIAGAGCALFLIWIGFRAVWQAVGAHETSRYQGMVKKALEQQWVGEGRRRRALKLIGVIWWLYVFGLVACLILSGPKSGDKRGELFAAFSAMLVSTAVTALATWAVRRRRRLFTFVCVPVTLAAGGVAFVVLTANNTLGLILLLLSVVCTVQTAIVFPLFLTSKQSTGSEQRRFPVKPWLDVVFGLLFATALLAFFYHVENRRGREALEKCQRQLEAKGAKLDWSNYMPPPIPDERNIFKAPNMQEWFVRQGPYHDWSWLDVPIGRGPLGDLLRESSPSVNNAVPTSVLLAQIKLVPLTKVISPVARHEADLVLRREFSSLSVLSENNPTNTARATNDEIVDTVSFDNVPVGDAINALVVQLGLKPEIDPELQLNGNITIKWRKVSIKEALLAVLANYGLCLVVERPGSPVQRIGRCSKQNEPIPSSDETTVNGEICPLIKIDGMPLGDTIKALALQAELNIEFEPEIQIHGAVTEQWRNLTAMQALYRLLDKNRLCLVNCPNSSIKRVVSIDSKAAGYKASDKVRAALQRVLEQTLGQTIIGPVNDLITQRPVDQTRPARIILMCDRTPATNDVARLFLDYLDNGSGQTMYFNPVRIDAMGSDSLSVSADIAGSADDYAAWNEKCEPQLEMVRQALRRPDARPEINYQNPLNQYAQNWVAVRMLEQMLGSTAEADLLRGDPEHALRQLTLMHALRHITEGPPGGQPESFNSAMMNLAVAGLYVGMIQSGLRCQAWREPQLTALQSQLKEIDLPGCLDRAFRREQMLVPRLMDITPRPEMVKLADLERYEYYGQGKPRDWNRWNRFRLNLFFRLVPQGWLDQNKAALLEADQPFIEVFKTLHHGLPARMVDELQDKPGSEFSPYAVLQSLFVRDFNRAVHITAKNQTQVNQVCMACALERYRLAHHEYPVSLDMLVPQFLDHIPADLIGGQPPAYHRNAGGGFDLSSAGWEEKERWSWPP